MADITVNINGDGGFSPSSINPNPGDTVVFVAEDDTVLCVEPDAVFGGKRFEIAAGSSVALTVQSDASNVDFSFSAVIGSLDLDCASSRGKDGGGRTGG
ncbi:MAG: hypothetical protein R3178_01775 [Rhodothermales bacterium]|nr:hypothetical protein [Rhodothermales bacterium]